MRAIVSKNNKFIQLSEKPKECISYALKIYLDKPQNDCSLPVATRSLVAGKIRYSLKELGYPNVLRIEIKNGNNWEVIMNKIWNSIN